MVTNGSANVGTLQTDARIIQYCTFNGLVWDKAALETVQTVAVGLRNLTELFKAQSVQIDALLKVQGDAKTNEEDIKPKAKAKNKGK